MERNRKHTASSGGGALYVAIALCLLAVGVGSWRLLRQKETGQTAAEAGTRAVSGSALIMEMTGNTGSTESTGDTRTPSATAEEAAEEAEAVEEKVNPEDERVAYGVSADAQGRLGQHQPHQRQDQDHDPKALIDRG